MTRSLLAVAALEGLLLSRLANERFDVDTAFEELLTWLRVAASPVRDAAGMP